MLPKVVGLEFKADGEIHRSEKSWWKASGLDKWPRKLLRHQVFPKEILLYG